MKQFRDLDKQMHLKFRMLISFFCLVFLTWGCASQVIPLEPPPPVTGKAHMTGSRGINVGEQTAEEPVIPPTPATGRLIKISCRAYLLKDKKEEPGYGLYSYILFPGRPGKNNDDCDRKRYIELYQLYRSKEEYLKKYQTYKKDQMNITYWPLSVQKLSADIDQHSDNFFVDNYDYARASDFLSKISGLTGPGPFIIAYHSPFSTISGSPDSKELLLIDLSKTPKENFQIWFNLFTTMVKDDPSTWQEKFNLKKIGLHIYDATELYGPGVFYACEWVIDKFVSTNALAAEPPKTENLLQRGRNEPSR